MKQKNYIAASILSANFAKLGEDIIKVVESGADIIHFDVMDNHYVPNLTIGPMVCKALREYGIKTPIDVHLMIAPVDRMISDFAQAGADFISFHPDASKDVLKSIELIKKHNCKVGIAISPDKSINCLEKIIDIIDMVVIMSVNPGFGGQEFITDTLDRLKVLRKIIDKKNLNVRLEIDGGVKTSNIKEIAKCGVDTFVAGSAIFKSKNYKETISAMRKELSLI